MEIANEKQKKEKEPLTTKQKVFLGLRIVGNVFFYSILLCLLIFSIMNINGGDRKKNFPNIFGRGFLSVQSDSMTRPGDQIAEEWKSSKIGSFDKGDLVNVKVFKKSNASKIDVGDVITFYDVNIDDLNTHRVVDIVYNSDGKATDFKCQGDKAVSLGQRYYTYEKYCTMVLNVEPEYETDGTTPKTSSSSYISWQQAMFALESDKSVVQTVSVGYVRGVVYSVKYGGGDTLDFITEHWLALFIMPVIAILIVEIFFVIRNIMVLRGEKNVAALDSRKEEIIAEEKERMRLELLAEMYGGMENIPEEMKNPKKTEAPKEEATEEVKEEVKEEKTEEVQAAPQEDNNVATDSEPVVEDKPEVESEVEPQEEKTEEENN